MKKPGPNRIAELRQAHGWSQRELADALSVHYMTISKLERGEMRLTQPWMEAIAKSLDVSPIELIENTFQKRIVVMNGAVGDGSSLHNIEGVFRDDERPTRKKALEFSFATQEDEIYLTMETEQFSPAIRENDIARFTRFKKDFTGESFGLGRICLFVFNDERAIFIGVPERGSEPGSYDLRVPTWTIRTNLRPDRIYVLTMVLSGSFPA